MKPLMTRWNITPSYLPASASSRKFSAVFGDSSSRSSKRIVPWFVLMFAMRLAISLLFLKYESLNRLGDPVLVVGGRGVEAAAFAQRRVGVAHDDARAGPF